jgi:WD40 repeat protein
MGDGVGMVRYSLLAHRLPQRSFTMFRARRYFVDFSLYVFLYSALSLLVFFVSLHTTLLYCYAQGEYSDDTCWFAPLINRWLYQPQLVNKSVAVLQHSKPVSKVTFTPDGQKLITGSQDGVRVWDVKEGRLLRYFDDFTGWVQCTISGDGRYLAMSGLPNKLIVWDLLEDRPYREFQELKDMVLAMQFVPERLQLAALSWDGTFHIWDISSGRHDVAVTCDAKYPHALSFSFIDSNRVIVGQWSKIHQLNKSGGLVGEAERMAGFEVVATTVLPGSRYVVMATTDGFLCAWDPYSVWENCPFNRASRQWAGQPQLALAQGVAGLPRYWDGRLYFLYDQAEFPEDWNRTYRYRTMLYFAVQAFPYGRYVAAGGSEGTIKIFDVPGGSEILRLKGHTGIVLSIAVSPDGSLLASGSKDKTVRLWNVDALRARP